MSQKPRKNKYANDNSQAEIIPTDRLDFLSALAMDHGISAKESMAVRVATVILKHRNNKTGLIILKHRTIAAEIGCGVTAVRTAIDVLVKRGWFKVEHQIINGEYNANKYIPLWDRASQAESDDTLEKGGISQNEQTPVAEQADPCRAADRAVSQDEQTSVAEQTIKTQVTELRLSKLGYQTQVSEPVSATRSDEPVKRSPDPFGEDRRSGGPTWNDDLEQFIAEMHTILPDHEEFECGEERKPFNAERSRRGELYRLRALIRAGWTKEEVREMVEAYVKDASDLEAGSGNSFQMSYKTLASIFSDMESQVECQAGFEGDDEFYGHRLPERFIRKPQDHPRSSANDNRRPPDRKASGDWDDIGF